MEKLIPFCLLIIACSSSEYIDNRKMIATIDLINISKIITEVNTDSIENILDTISISYYKYDNENKKRYRKKVLFHKRKKISFVDYYKSDEGLFYRESFNFDGKAESIFETKTNKEGRIVKAIQINTDGEVIDTTIMNYSHEFHANGKKKEIVIHAIHEGGGEFKSKVVFDITERPLFELSMLNNDTLNFQIWEYTDSVLNRCVYTNYQRDTSKIIYYFGREKILIKEKGYKLNNGSFAKSKEINYFYDKAAERIKSVEKNIETEEVTYIKYLKE